MAKEKPDARGVILGGRVVGHVFHVFEGCYVRVTHIHTHTHIRQRVHIYLVEASLLESKEE